MSNPEFPLQNTASSESITGANLDISINPSAYDILDTMVSGYQENVFPYCETILPQEYKPDSLRPDGEHHGSHLHAMYFWNICSYMSGRTKSDLAFQRVTEMFDENPDLFDCQTLSKTDPTIISESLKRHGLGRQGLVAENWVKNAQKIIDQFDGDPRNIFNDISSYEDCVTLIKNDGKGNGFPGFREKMTSMILYFFMDEKLIPEMDFPLPVDFHALRVAIATEMITVEPLSFYKHSGKVEDAIRQLFQNYLSDRDVNSVDLTNSVWLLSSNLCNQNIGNASSSAKSQSRTRTSYQEMDPNNLSHSESWYRSCGKCLIEKYCRYYIPSGPYYTQGAILPREKLTREFVKQLSFLDKLV
jgi:Predicted EndoIII-related endonuclease